MSTVTARYFVTDLDAAVAFYRDLLGFEEELRPSPAFAMLYRGDLQLLLSVPGGPGGGGAPMPDGTLPQPGGWNRIALRVDDLPAAVDELRDKGARFRNDIVTGRGVRQILIQDPSGNLTELFEPLAAYHERAPRAAGAGRLRQPSPWHTAREFRGSWRPQCPRNPVSF